MKVLWFTNSPSLAKMKLNQVSFGGGWMESLQDKLQINPDINLALSFYTKNTEKPFLFNDTYYFPLNYEETHGKINRFITRITHEIESEKKEIKKYLSVIEQFQPDIIHIFGTEFPFGLIADKTRIPVLIWIQGNITVINLKWYSGITINEVKNNTSLKNKIKWVGLLHEYPKMRKIALREQNIFKKCRYFLGRTDWDKRISKILSPEAKYFHCEEMLRPHFYNSKFEANYPKSEYFIIVSVLNPNIYKGFETIFQTMCLLKEQYFKYKIKWQIVGVDGTEEIIKLTEKIVGIKPKDLNIEYVGKLKSDTLVQILLNADLFVHPSHIENSPNSICEAMTIGMPIICSHSGGVSSLLKNNEEGFLIQDGDPYALGGAIIEIIEDYEKALDFGRKARKRALIRHNPENIINSLLGIYKKILNEHS